MKLNRRIRGVIAVIILTATLGLFAYYVSTHLSIINELKQINPWLLLLLLGCYGIMLLCWMSVYNATLSLCGKPLKTKENMLLSIYSTLANFFLPLQSGPGVRATYLKRQHKVPIGSYIIASLIYFSIYAIISAVFLFTTSHYWWLIAPSVCAVALISYLFIRFAKKHYSKRFGQIILDFSPKKIAKLFLFTLCQLIVQAFIYGTELANITNHIYIIRSISYTGAANFSLFVSLTPGAIGFREAFLEFSRQLHHYTTAQILGANIIDRGVFLVFLVILLIAALFTHALDRINKLTKDEGNYS